MFGRFQGIMDRILGNGLVNGSLSKEGQAKYQYLRF